MVVEMMRKNRWSTVAALLVVTALTCTTAQAALLTPGNTQFPAAAEPDPTGGVVLATQTIPFSVPGFFDGTLTSTVRNQDPSNPFGPAAMTFTYVLSNSASSPNAMARLTTQDFTGFQTDVSYQSTSAGVAPAFIDRLTADVVGFSFSAIAPGAPIFPGQQSRVLVIQTDATAFTNTTASIIDSGALAIPTFGPVPEPGMLGLAAFGALALVRRRR